MVEIKFKASNNKSYTQVSVFTSCVAVSPFTTYIQLPREFKAACGFMKLVRISQSSSRLGLTCRLFLGEIFSINSLELASVCRRFLESRFLGLNGEVIANRRSKPAVVSVSIFRLVVTGRRWPEILIIWGFAWPIPRRVSVEVFKIMTKGQGSQKSCVYSSKLRTSFLTYSAFHLVRSVRTIRDWRNSGHGETAV